MNDDTKVQIISGKTCSCEKFFCNCAQICHIRKRLRCFLRKKSNIILSIINKLLSLHKINCKLYFAICNERKSNRDSVQKQ